MNLATLRQRLKSEDEGERLLAVNEALADSPFNGLSVLLVQQLPLETSQMVREAIVFTLQKLRSPECFPDLFTLFRSDDAFLRNATMTIFGECSETAVDFLEQQLISADREVRKLILDACVLIASPAAVRIIRNALYDPAVNVRITAADYLGRLRDTESAELLLHMFHEDTEPMFRVSVLESLSAMNEPHICQTVLTSYIATPQVPEDEALFLPILLRIAGNCNNTEIMARLLMHLPSLQLYAEDVILAVQNMQGVVDAHAEHDANYGIIIRVLREVLEGRNIRSDLRYAALTTLAAIGQDVHTIVTESLINSFEDTDFRELVADFKNLMQGSHAAPRK